MPLGQQPRARPAAAHRRERAYALHSQDVERDGGPPRGDGLVGGGRRVVHESLHNMKNMKIESKRVEWNGRRAGRNNAYPIFALVVCLIPRQQMYFV